MHYCQVICRVSSTDHIYHRAASRLGDKCDRSMTLGKLLGNNALLFIFISLLLVKRWHYVHFFFVISVLFAHFTDFFYFNWSPNYCQYTMIQLHVYLPTQLSHRLQWEALGGRNILQVKQYFSFITWPLMTTSFVRGGGRYVPGVWAFGCSATNYNKMFRKHVMYASGIIGGVIEIWTLWSLFCPSQLRYRKCLMVISI